ncbi:MAG TPA: hypothetical protein VFK09_11415 [Gemmatimonadales bacterium]|jgi:hypothetical protein|nr:hypothetical protein [Gemmatimonadales bacterium]
MQLTLTEHEAEILRGLLHDYLPDLRREVARTDEHELRHLFVQRQELAERLLGELERAAR